MKFMAMYYDIKEVISSNEAETNKNNGNSNNRNNNNGNSNVNLKRNNSSNTYKSSDSNKRNHSNNDTSRHKVNIAFKTEEETVIRTKEEPITRPEEESFNDFVIPITNNMNNKFEPASKKRSFPATKHSPERNLRRMTNSLTVQRTPPSAQRISPVIQRTPPVKPAARDRRLSYLPNQKTNVHKSPTAITQITPITPIAGSTINNDLNQRIRVCVRKRPLNRKEKEMQESDIVSLVGIRTIQLNAPK